MPCGACNSNSWRRCTPAPWSGSPRSSHQAVRRRRHATPPLLAGQVIDKADHVAAAQRDVVNADAAVGGQRALDTLCVFVGCTIVSSPSEVSLPIVTALSGRSSRRSRRCGSGSSRPAASGARSHAQHHIGYRDGHMVDGDDAAWPSPAAGSSGAYRLPCPCPPRPGQPPRAPSPHGFDGTSCMNRRAAHDHRLAGLRDVAVPWAIFSCDVICMPSAFESTMLSSRALWGLDLHVVDETRHRVRRQTLLQQLRHVFAQTALPNGRPPELRRSMSLRAHKSG